ncbi:MAG: hypothetical protein WBL99_02355 [Candidatus Acidiferrales bacterium]
MPMRGELPPVSTRAYARRPSALENAWSQLAAAVCNNDVQAVVLFCGIGLLLTINVIVRFPEFGAQIAELAVFP